MNKYNILKEYERNLMYLEDILGSKETNNIELDRLGRFLFGFRFIGVFSSDNMPVLQNNNMCIVNTDSSRKAGTHWVACYKYRNKTYVHDTFDRDVKSLSKFWKHKHNWINANSDRLQSYEEYNCGTRCLAFLISFDKWKTKILNIL
jgi:hypothetical protein